MVISPSVCPRHLVRSIPSFSFAESGSYFAHRVHLSKWCPKTLNHVSRSKGVVIHVGKLYENSMSGHNFSLLGSIWLKLHPPKEYIWAKDV